MLVLNLAFEFNKFEGISEMRFFFTRQICLILNHISSISLLFLLFFVVVFLYCVYNWSLGSFTQAAGT